MGRRKEPTGLYGSVDELLTTVLNLLVAKQIVDAKSMIDDREPWHRVLTIAIRLGRGNKIDQLDLDYLLDFHGGQKFIRNPLPHMIQSRISFASVLPDPESREDLRRVLAYELLRHIHDQELQAGTPGRRRLKNCENCQLFYLTPKGRPQTRYCGRSCVNSAGEKRRRAAAGEEAATKKKKKTGKKAGKTTGGRKATKKPTRKSAKKATKRKGG